MLTMGPRDQPRNGGFRSPRGARGASMIEVLVSLVIISIGLLGNAGLLLQANKSNLSSYFRTQATVMAHDIIESMRVNRTAATSGDYNIALGSAAAAGDLAGEDLIRWKSLLAQHLPAGNGAVTVDISGKTTVVIQWDDDGDGVATSFTTQTDL